MLFLVVRYITVCIVYKQQVNNRSEIHMLTTQTPSARRNALRAAVAKDLVMAPGVYDALSARAAEAAGAQALFVTGAGVSASLLGTPDFGLLTMTEVRDQVRNIVRSTDLPVIADCDTGYGNAINTIRTVQEFEAAGVSALFLEDQVAPKKCGHFAGKEVVSTYDMCRKLEAALDAREDEQLMIIARTDARAVNGLNDAISRAKAYAEVGVDMVFVEAPQTTEEVEQVLAELDGTAPVMVNLVEGGKTPLIPQEDLQAMGVRLLTYSGSGQKAALKTLRDVYRTLVESEPIENFYPSRMMSLDERSDLLKLPAFYELEQRYS